MSKEIETLEKEIQSIENKEVELKNKKGILYNKMLDIAREEGRKAKALPNSYTGERGHIGSERRNAYLEVHQEECGHGSIRFGAEDDVLVLMSYNKAAQGMFAFYKDLQDRLHGTAKQSIDLTTKEADEEPSERVKQLADLLRNAHKLE